MHFFRKNFLIIVIILIGLVVISYLIRYFSIASSENNEIETTEISVQEIPFTPEGELQIFRGENLIKALEIEFANTESERELGLMYRSSMKENRGMLFIFPDELRRSFYMKNTQLPLDILYINSEMKIIDIVKNAVPYDETSLPSAAPAKYALEINGGMSDKWGLQIDDSIQYK